MKRELSSSTRFASDEYTRGSAMNRDSLRTGDAQWSERSETINGANSKGYEQGVLDDPKRRIGHDLSHT